MNRTSEVSSIWSNLWEENEELDAGLQVGKVVAFHVADSLAVYEITEIGGEISRVTPRDDLSPHSYQSQAVTEDGRIFTETLEKACNRIDFRLETHEAEAKTT